MRSKHVRAHSKEWPNSHIQMTPSNESEKMLCYFFPTHTNRAVLVFPQRSASFYSKERYFVGGHSVLARDCFIAYLNAKPAGTAALLADPVAKRRFELSKIPLETLAAHNFNLSTEMGTLLAQQQDL